MLLLSLPFFYSFLLLYYWVTIAVEDEDTWCQHHSHRLRRRRPRSLRFFVWLYGAAFVFHQQFRGRKCSWKFNYHFLSAALTRNRNRKKKNKTKLETESGADFTCIISFIFDLRFFFRAYYYCWSCLVWSDLVFCVFLFGRRCTSNAKRMERAKEIEMQFVCACD